MHRPLLSAAVLICISLINSRSADAQSSLPKLDGLAWRPVGPAIMGGRIDDFAVDEKNPSLFYVATATGGLWKTVNRGTTFTPVFDDQATNSIGDVTLAPSNPDVVWVGTGESNNRQSSTWGNGVYRSTDGAKTWKHLGLQNTHHIGRIVVHPTNPDTAWVAAAGHLWGPNPERGVYKTTDGGATWQHTLFINNDTGVNDIAIDPQNPQVLYAAAYQRRRTAFGFNGGGPGSGFYKSTDGGSTWRKITQGLPTGDIGRIGIDVYRKDPRVVVIVLEHANGGVFRSEDAGETFTKTSSTNPRPMYFSQIRIDPNNDKNIWMAGVPMYSSTDGGKTFTTSVITRIHVDYHAIWINPADSRHMMVGTDGGIHISYDGGRTMDHVNTIPLAQLYEVHYDMRRPYYVYGGLQDNGTWAGPSATPFLRGVTNDDWTRVGSGDGFYVRADPTDWRNLYVESQQGFLGRLNQATGERKSIRPSAPAGEPAYRFDWNSPIEISPHNPKKILFAGNRLFVSYDRGDSWKRSEDLSNRPDRTKMPIMGVLPSPRVLSLHDGQESFGQIVTISESPRRQGLIYAGTDDGNLQISTDDGKTFTNIVRNVQGVPAGTYVNRVLASAHAEGRVYACFDGHRSDDMKPYLFVSEDFGATWRPLSSGLPSDEVVRVVREHPRNADLLFIGTERGLYVSLDRGTSWNKFGMPFPNCRVDDIQIHPRENDLIVGTHARGVYILDGIGWLEQWTAAQAAPVHLFPPKPAVHWRRSDHKTDNGHKLYEAPNPPIGAVLEYMLDKAPGSTPVLSIWTRDGRTKIREIRLPLAEKGRNRTTWDLRAAHPADRAPRPTAQAPGTGRRGGGGQAGGGGFGLRGPRALPGTYLVRLEVDGRVSQQTITVDDDPRTGMSSRDLKAQYDLLMQVAENSARVDSVRTALQSVSASLAEAARSESVTKAPGKVAETVAAARKAVEALTQQIAGRPAAAPAAGEGQETSAPVQRTAGSLTARLQALQFGIEAVSEAPGETIRRNAKEAFAAADAVQKGWRQLVQREIAAANASLKSAGAKEITVPAVLR
jgi:photosystem II stability/assembly factor-like uncharacterized protein